MGLCKGQWSLSSYVASSLGIARGESESTRSMGLFAEALAARRASSDAAVEGEWVFDQVTDGFDVFAAVNGGVLMAMMLRAMTDEQRMQTAAGRDSGNVDCFSLTCAFVGSTASLRSCSVRVQAVKRGRRVSFLRSQLVQGGSVRIDCSATFGRFDDSAAERTNVGFDSKAAAAAAMAQRTDLVEPSGTSELLADRKLFSQWRTRYPPRDWATFLKMVGYGDDWDSADTCPTSYSYLARHADASDDTLTLETLAALADANIPTVKSVPGKHEGWNPTLVFNSTFFARPAPSLTEVLAIYRLGAHSDARTSEECDIFDPITGQLLCHSRQSGLINIAQSSKLAPTSANGAKAAKL